MKVETSLRDFVKLYPVYRAAFQNLLSDPEYIVKYICDENGKLKVFELGYKEDIFSLDRQ